MALSDEFLDDLRRRADIESTVSSYVSLKRKGKILTGLCPFHNEKTPVVYRISRNAVVLLLRVRQRRRRYNLYTKY